jgi:carboxypeptidase C (cathepsin A)
VFVIDGSNIDFNMILLVVSLLSTLLASAEACNCSHCDFVPHLPGFNQPLPSPWWSGFLDYQFEGHLIHTHYVLVQAEDDFHQNKPLIYWSNGGPGASSLFGLLTELGPLLLSDRSLDDSYRATGIPTPIYNPYSWTRLGSILIIDQPAPVGFSYCDDDPESTTCLSWTDELAARNSFLALQAFYRKFPCFNTTELYLTGESYGGIYIPMLAREIFQSKLDIPLQGFAVGDGCLGTETGICGSLGKDDHTDSLWETLFLAGHGQIPLKTLQAVMKSCRPDATTFHLRSADNAECEEALSKMREQAGGFYEYSLYDDCTYRNDFMLKGAANDYPCGGSPVMTQYLALPSVKQALHVSRATFYSVDNAEGFDYTPTERDLRDFYREINGELRVLIYNGDADPGECSRAAVVVRFSPYICNHSPNL